jgi:hypothetical protein
VQEFRDVGATRLVTLSDRDRGLLFELIELWSHRVTVDELPPGVWLLRIRLGPAGLMPDEPNRRRLALRLQASRAGARGFPVVPMTTRR